MKLTQLWNDCEAIIAHEAVIKICLQRLPFDKGSHDARNQCWVG